MNFSINEDITLKMFKKILELKPYVIIATGHDINKKTKLYKDLNSIFEEKSFYDNKLIKCFGKTQEKKSFRFTYTTLIINYNFSFIV